MSNENSEPILVLNPENGHYINIAPLLDFVNENYDGSFHELANSIDEVIRLLACTPFPQGETDNLSLSSRFYFLYGLRDVISSISEFKEERRAL